MIIIEYDFDQSEDDDDDDDVYHTSYMPYLYINPTHHNIHLRHSRLIIIEGIK